MKIIETKFVPILVLLLICLFLQSCKKCQTCECHKNGVVYEERECGRSTDHQDYFRNWQRHLIENIGYDYCECQYD